MASLMENFSNKTIDISSLPNYEEVEFNAISNKYLIKSNFQTAIFMAFVCFGWGALFYYESGFENLVFSFIAIILFFGFKFWNNYMVQRNYGYALREKDILYRRGFFVVSTTVIPFNRIQHASISRDALDKLLDLSSVQVFTAGGSASDISIPGLKPQLALRLKEGLATRISSNEN